MEQTTTARPSTFHKTITIGADGKKHYPDGTIFTKLKFKRSDKADTVVGFVSQNPKDGRYCGVREDSDFPKKVCLVDKSIAPDIIMDALYDVAMIPMLNQNGYIVLEATVHQFRAVLEVDYYPRANYRVTLKFGGKSIVFDPMNPPTPAANSLSVTKELIAKRLDIKNVSQVVEDFMAAATSILHQYKKDGYPKP